MDPTKMVASRVRDLRRKRGWTAQQLAENMTAAGIAWNRGVVTKLENGRRDAVSLEELLTLAWVFDVAPLVLMLPDDPEAPVAITPAVSGRAERVYRWIAGATPVPVDTDETTHPGTWGPRTARYAVDRPTYMTRSLDEDPDLRARVDRQDKLLSELHATLLKISNSGERSEDGNETD